MSGAIEDLRQRAAEETLEQAELAAVVEDDALDEGPDDDQVIPWRRSA